MDNQEAQNPQVEKVLTEYHTVVDAYIATIQRGWSKFVVEYTVLNVLNKNYENKDVLDLACGDGIYSRKFADVGAKSVTGVDVTIEMIEKAKCYSARYQNVEYLIEDCLQLDLKKQFDVVSAIFLLNYSKTKDELRGFAKTIKKHLKPDGIFIAFNDNPDSTNTPEDHKKFGWQKLTLSEGEAKDGDEV